MPCWKRPNYRDRKQISGCPELGAKDTNREYLGMIGPKICLDYGGLCKLEEFIKTLNTVFQKG
jgi:hypothetical protein